VRENPMGDEEVREMKRQRMEKPMGDEELREMERQGGGGGERVGDEEVREREREREGKMTWTSVGEEIMTWRCLEENFFFFSQL
jgi:hypothetical protein